MRKNYAKLIELGEVFALEKFPSQREASHTLQSRRIFQSRQKFGRGTNFALQNSEAVVPNRLISCLPTRTQRSGVRAQRGRSERSERRSFLTAENPIGAVVFTYFNISNCEADISLVVRGGNSVCFCFFFRKRRGLGWTLCGKLVGR